MENQAYHAQQIQAETVEVKHTLDRTDPLPDSQHYRSSGDEKSAAANADATVLIDSERKGNADDNPKNKPGGYGYYFRLWTYTSPIDIFIRVCGVFAACGAGAALPLMTIVFGQLVNDFNSWGSGAASGETLRAAVNQNALYFVYLFIGKFALVYIHTSAFTVTATKATRNIRRAYIQSLLRQDISYFDTCTPGSVATSISNNADLIHNGMAEKIGTVFQGLAMLAAAYIVALTQGWKLALVTATTMPAAIVGVGITVALDARLEAKILAIYAEAGGLVEEALGSVRIVTAFGASEKLSKKYDIYLEKAKAFGVKKGPILGIQYSSEFFTMYCAYALAFWYGIRLLLAGEMSSGGSVVTVLFSVVIGTSAITMLAPSLGDIAKAGAAAKAVLDVIDQEPVIDPLGDGGEKPETVSGRVSFQSVSFAYPARPSVQVLQKLSLELEARKTTAIVGASGSGKSTIVGLTERWYDPAEGQIFVDGRDIKELNVKWLRSQIGLVQQEPVLFNDTIYNNVVHGLYGSDQDDLPEEEKRKLVQQACEEANAHDFIQDLADRYDTKVGERAGFISGGQKQRIAIARSIVSNPKILLLDEATSALDPNAEGIVQAALDKVSQTRTTLMIAHKLSTVKKADKIIVMNQGRVVEQGTPKSLLAAGGAYSRLVNAQNLDAVDDGEEEMKVRPDENEAQDVGLDKVQTTRSTTSAKAAPEPENISRKFSLFRCILIIFYEQRRFWHLLAGGLVFSALAGGVFPAQAVVFSRVVTVFQLPESMLQREGNFWALMFFVVALGTLVSYALLGFFLTVSAFLIARNYRGDYFKAMLRQDIAFYDADGNSSGALTARLSTDPQRLQDLLSANIGLIVIVIVNLLSCCILALAVGWKLAIVGIFGALPPLFFAGFARMRLEKKSQDMNAAMYQESARFASEAVGAIRTVSSLTLEGKVVDNYGLRLDDSVKKAYKHIAKSMFLFGLSESLDLAVLGLTFWWGGKLLAEGEYNATDFFLVFVAIVFGGQAAGFLFGFTLNTTKAQAGANQILHLRDQKPPINSSTGTDMKTVASSNDSIAPAIEFRDVRFNYPTRAEYPVLRKISLKIQRGQTVGIVGASGCGKTTIITLLERFYDVTSGQILIHGQPLSSLDVRSYRVTVGLVSQDTTLYQGTLRENILLGASDNDLVDDTESETSKTEYSSTKNNQEEAEEEPRLIAACKAANIHTFILSLPEGYNTQAGSRGLSLSGGQRQRVAIARALVRDPSILLLDEATSALDTQSEGIVQAALETAAKGRTVVAVAHRLSTVRGADCIFVLDRGAVVETGSHAELVKRKGRYWEMVQAQSLDREAK